MPDDTAYRAAWLLLHDEEFLKAHEHIDPKVFPPGPLRYLTDLALRQWADYHTTLTATVVDQATDAEDRNIRRAKATPESVIRVYLELDTYAPEEDALPYVRGVCKEWLEQFALGAYVEKAGDALDRGDLEKAREALGAGLSPVAREREGIRLSEFIGQPLPKPLPGAIPTGLYELDRLWSGGIRPAELGLLLGPTNVGKALSLDTPILTLDGWSTMGDLQPGTQIFDERGESCHIVWVSDVMGNRPVYRVEFSDGSVIKADGEHLWSVGYLYDKGRCPRRELTTEQLRDALGRSRRPPYYIDVAGPLNWALQDLPIDPYVLGVWLGDGRAAGAEITTADEEIVDALAGYGYDPHQLGSTRYGYGTYGLWPKLRKAGLLNNKHIPGLYLRAGVGQRLALLQGLMDTDGTVCPSSGLCEISQKSEGLASNVRELIHSLGMKTTYSADAATLYGKDCGTRHRIRFMPRLFVFRLQRKRQHLRMPPARRQARRYMRSIQPIPPEPVRCIMVDSPSRLYLAGESLIPTHNSMVAVSFAAQAYWKGRDVLYYTFELTPNQIMERIICAILEVGPKTLKRQIGEDAPEAAWHQALERVAHRRRLTAVGDTDIDVRTGTMTIRDLIHELDEYKRERGTMPGLLLLDSADELATGHKQKATWEELRDIFTGLRSEVAHKRRLPVWTTGQATREAVDKAVINLKHVGASFAKAQKSHYVLGLAQSSKQDDELGEPQINVYVLKDTLHGTRGGWLRCMAKFGRGGDGYAALESYEVFKLPVLMGREEDPE